MDLSNWKSQIRKGLIEFCLLNIVDQRGQAYGLELLDGLNSANLEVSEGTLYPLLSRMVRDKYLSPKWETPTTGHPRKYYKLTTQGKRTLEDMKSTWSEISSAIDELCNGSTLSDRRWSRAEGSYGDN